MSTVTTAIGPYVIQLFLSLAVLSLGLIIGLLINSSTIAKLRKSNSELMAEQRDGVAVSPSQLAEFKRIVAEHTVLNEEQNRLITYLRNTFPGVATGQYAGMNITQMVMTIIREVKEK